MNTLTLKALMLATIVFMLPQTTHSQNMVFGKIDFINGEGINRVNDIHIDIDDNTYITGSFTKDCTIDAESMKEQDAQSIFIAKYNKDGILQFTKQISGSGVISAHSLTSDSKNNIYLSGTFKKICRFGDKEITAKTWQDNFIVKLSPKGEFLAVKHIEANTKDEQSLLICDKNDNLYYAGSFYKTLIIDKKELESTSGSDIFIAKFDKGLKLQNLKQIEGKNKDIISDIAISKENRIFITGSFTDNIKFDKETLKSEGRKDIFLAEINMNSEDISNKFIQKYKQIGGLYDDYPSKLLIQNNKLFLTGSFSSKVKFGKTTLSSEGILDVFVSSYKLNGKELWAKSFGGQANDYARSIVISKKGNIYVTGSFRESIKSNEKTIKTEGHQSDNFIAVLSDKGELKNIENFGGDDNDFSVATVINSKNVLYHTGTYRTDFIFGSQKSTSKTKHNIFLAEMYDCDNTELNIGEDIEICSEQYTIKPDIEFETYLWSNNSTEKETTITESGTYTLTVTDRFGCSATDEINITLLEIPTTDLGEDMIIEKGNTATINAEPGFDTYLWTSEDIVDFNASEETLTINTQELPKGEYTFNLLATDQNGCTCEDQIKMTILKVQAEANINSFSAEIIPNPNDGRFTLYINNADTKSNIIYEIYSPDGKLILKKKAESLKEEVNLQKQSEGSYILRLMNGTIVLNKVIIVSEK